MCPILDNFFEFMEVARLNSGRAGLILGVKIVSDGVIFLKKRRNTSCAYCGGIEFMAFYCPPSPCSMYF